MLINRLSGLINNGKDVSSEVKALAQSLNIGKVKGTVQMAGDGTETLFERLSDKGVQKKNLVATHDIFKGSISRDTGKFNLTDIKNKIEESMLLDKKAKKNGLKAAEALKDAAVKVNTAMRAEPQLKQLSKAEASQMRAGADYGTRTINLEREVSDLNAQTAFEEQMGKTVKASRTMVEYATKVKELNKHLIKQYCKVLSCLRFDRS